jgi:spore maturation protein B
MKNFGVDSYIGNLVSTIMGSTETTIYTIAIYTSIVKIKKTRNVLFAALMGDVLGMAASVVIRNILS